MKMMVSSTAAAVLCALIASVSAGVTSLKRRDGGQLITSCTVPNTVALTFDDGPHIYTTEIVDMIKAAGGKATFFVNGNNWNCIYDDAMASSIKYAYDNGFQIGSHTWLHQDMTTLSHDDLDSVMARTEEAIVKITGAAPAFTRPPYGSYNDDVLAVAALRSQTVVNWDVDSGDSLAAEVDDQKKVYDNAVELHPSSILSLQHEVYDSTVHQVLPYTIGKMQAAGYRMVTLAECLGLSPYLSVGNPSAKDDTWQCT